MSDVGITITIYDTTMEWMNGDGEIHIRHAQLYLLSDILIKHLIGLVVSVAMNHRSYFPDNKSNSNSKNAFTLSNTLFRSSTLSDSLCKCRQFAVKN